MQSRKRALGEEYAYLVIRKEDEILGFVTVIKDGDTAIGYILGFDREAAQGLPLYLRLLQAVVERAPGSAVPWEHRLTRRTGL